MNILYFTTSFPRANKGSTIYTDLAEALSNNGHNLTVVVADEKRNGGKSLLSSERGFDVLRIVVGDFYNVGFVKKGFSTITMPYIMIMNLSIIKDRKFDFILFESPPVTLSKLIKYAKKHFNCPAFLMLKDIFPQNGVDIELIKNNSLIHKFFLKKERELYKVTDYIGCMSLGNREYLLNHNQALDPNRIKIFPNTKLFKNIVDDKSSNIRKELNIPSNACIFIFGGNMGRPQYIDLLSETIREFKENRNMFFVFVGRGTDRYKLETYINTYGIRNVVLLDDLPRPKYEEILKESDVGLIILDPRFTIPNYPSRILSYMEYAKPVLAATDLNTDFQNLIYESGCGKWVYSGDKEAFFQAIRDLSSSSDRIKMGKKGREYAIKYFGVEKSVYFLERLFNSEDRNE